MPEHSTQLPLSFKTFWFPIALLVFLVGCQSQLPVLQRPSVDMTHWPTFARENSQAIHALKGRAKLTVESPQMSGTMQVTVIWKEPDTLYLAAEGPLGINLGKVFVGSHRFMIYNEYQNQFISGSLDNPYLTRFLQTSFSLKELKFILLGTPPSGWYNLQPAPGKAGLFIQINNGIKYRYHVNLRTGLLEKWEMVTPAGTEMVMTLERYRQINGVWFPRLIRLTRPRFQERISVFYEAVAINQPIARKLYTIVIKPGVHQLNVE